MVVIEVDNTQGRILSALTLDQITVISQMCSFQVEASEYKQNAFRAKSNGKNQWDGYRRLFHSGRQTFPIGLLPRIMNLFNTCGIPVNLMDKRVHMDRQFDLPCTPRERRQYQYDIMMSSILNGNGTVKAATGSGKTTMAALTTSALGKPSVFIVHTKDLLYQAKEAFKNLHGCEIGQIGDGVVDPKNITVATVQTLAKAADIFYTNYKYDEDASDDDSMMELSQDSKLLILKWARTVGIVQFDEVQRVASRTAYDVRFMFRNADNAFGYSASPWRDDGSDLMIEAAFGPVICDVSASQLILEGWLVRPEITIKTVGSNVWDGSNYGTIYRTAVVENMFRNMQVVQDAEGYWLDKRTTLVLVTQIKHGETIETMLRSSGVPAQFISGKSKTRYRKQVIEDMRNGMAPVVIATTIADVGLDVPRISAIVEAGAGKSSVTALQRVGRGTRKFPGKHDFLYTTYRDVAPIICNHIDNKIRIWRTEPEFIIREE